MIEKRLCYRLDHKTTDAEMSSSQHNDAKTTLLHVCFHGVVGVERRTMIPGGHIPRRARGRTSLVDVRVRPHHGSVKIRIPTGCGRGLACGNAQRARIMQSLLRGAAAIGGADSYTRLVAACRSHIQPSVIFTLANQACTFALHGAQRDNRLAVLEH
eukprot:scaffold416298_cov34-Prasinocladus_malaysianus.AAC.4